jgi:cobalt-zinc-cadmium efflux system membrane fusion protein
MIPSMIRRTLRLRGWTTAMAVLIACASTAACNRQPPPAAEPPQEAAIPVAAVPASTGSLRTTVHATGVVRPTEGAEFLVVSPEPARVLEVTKNEGDRVASGEVLARFDLPAATQEATRQRAELARAQADMERARQAHARIVDFVERGLVPRRDRDDADRQLADADAALKRVTAALAAAEASVARDTVRATFDGVVATRLHNPGDLVQASSTDPVLRVVDPKRIEVSATIEDVDLPRVLPGATARTTDPADGTEVVLTVSGPPTRPAVAGVSPTVRLTFQRPSKIPVDARVDVEIDAGERRDVIFLPPEAVLQANGLSVVMVAVDDHASRRVVTTGVTGNGQIEIVSGIRTGDLVITRGQIGLEDGALVSVAVERR